MFKFLIRLTEVQAESPVPSKLFRSPSVRRLPRIPSPLMSFLGLQQEILPAWHSPSALEKVMSLGLFSWTEGIAAADTAMVIRVAMVNFIVRVGSGNVESVSKSEG
jgi:hypothetical protein